MRLDLHVSPRETAVTRVAERFGIMATVALLGVSLCLQRVDGYKVAAMTLWLVIAPGVSLGKVITGTATFVTIEAPFLLVALGAVAPGLACEYTVPAQKVRVVVQRDTFRFVAAVAITYRRISIFGMSGFLFSIRLLLEADKSKAENCKS